MKKILYFFATALVALSMQSCSEDETIFPDYEKDWFVLQDSSDPAEHAAYTFYQKYGFPVFLNDTIGTQQRIDQFGQEYTYSKVLSLNSSMGGGVSAGSDGFYGQLVYADKAIAPEAINYLKDKLMPLIPSFLHIHSILLVEGIQYQQDALRIGLNTLLIAKASQLSGYTEAQTKSLASSITSAYLSKSIVGNVENNEQLERFYNVSREIYANADVYNYSTWYFSNRYMEGCPFDAYDYSITAEQKMNWAGFINAQPPYFNTSPTTQQDVSMFIEAYLNYTESEFREKYAESPRIIKKYEIIKPMLDKILK